MQHNAREFYRTNFGRDRYFEAMDRVYGITPHRVLITPARG